MCPETTQDNPKQKTHHGTQSPPLICLAKYSRGQEVWMGKEVTIQTCQHDTSQTIVLQHPARHSLPTTLECDESQGYQNSPAQCRPTTGTIDSDNRGSDDDADQLHQKRCAQDPAIPWRKCSMESREAERPKAEPANRDSGLDPAVVVASHEAETKIDRVACLHAHERAPDEDCGAVEESGDDVAGKE